MRQAVSYSHRPHLSVPSGCKRMRGREGRTRTILFAVLFVTLGAAGGTAQEAKVRASIETKGELWVGQRVTLLVELLAPGFFSGTAAFDLPTVPGLMIAPPEGSPIVASETIDAATYTVQRHELAVFSRRAGEQTIPPITVRFRFKQNPLDKDSIAAEAKTEPVPFRVKLPPGAEKLGSLISARNLKVEEVWTPEPGRAKAGDAVTRTITFIAPEVPAMALPPFPADKIEGLGIYPKPPEVLDESNRGNLTGKRRDTIIYLCQRAGDFTIPAVRLTWFDLDAQKLQTIDFPARHLSVSPNPALSSTATDKKIFILWTALYWLLGVAIVASIVTFCRGYWMPWLARALDSWRPVHLQPLNPIATKSSSAPPSAYSARSRFPAKEKA